MNRLQKIIGASLFPLALIIAPTPSYSAEHSIVSTSEVHTIEVLTTSASDYAKSVSHSLKDYLMKGVHAGSKGYPL